MAEQPSLQQQRRARWHFGAHAVLAFIAVGLVAVPFSILVLLVTAKSDPMLHVDHDTANSLHSFAVAHPSFTSAMKLVSRIGSPMGWWIVLTPVFGWLIYRRLPRLAAFLAVTALGSSLLNNLIKATVDRARPHLPDPVEIAHGTSFPSGHTQAATVGFGILVLIFLPLARRGLRPWLYAAATLAVALIGFSRIALGVHYLSDVLGGIVIGAAWLLAMTAAFSAWRREEHKPPQYGEGLEPEQQQRLRPGDAESASPEQADHPTGRGYATDQNSLWRRIRPGRPSGS
ncbi:MAG TPA: phosphatase PAP2 family protein [Mycobacterium sp.]|nr:phosphatase PAP2 family protein [Mycobacterium sp.]